MSPSITSRAFEILSRRGWHILACSFATGLVMVAVLMAVAIPTFLKQKQNAQLQQQRQQPSWVDPSQAPADPYGNPNYAQPEEQPDQDVGGIATRRVSHELGQPPYGAQPSYGSPPGQQRSAPPSGEATAIGLAIMGVLGLFWLASFQCGVFAACGRGIGASYGHGLRTFPMLMTQSLRFLPLPIVINLVLWGVGLAFQGSYATALAYFFVSFAIQLAVLAHFSARMSVASAGLAHGHENWSARVTLERIGDRGPRLTLTMVGAWVISWVPILGMVYLQAAAAAMWEKLEDDGGHGPRHGSSDDDSGSKRGPSFMRAADETPTPLLVASASAGKVAAIAVPAGLVAATQPGPVVAGPSWQAAATPSAPAGEWLHLAAPGRAAIQVQWADGAPPYIQLADEHGAWRTPAEQPASTGATTWLDLPAGFTWVAVTPRDPSQQLWVTSWIPSAAAGGGAAQAA